MTTREQVSAYLYICTLLESILICCVSMYQPLRHKFEQYVSYNLYIL